MSKNMKQELVPKLRFPEFENSVSWFNEPLENIYSFKVTNSLSRDKLNYKAGTVKNIHYGDIHTKYSTLFDVEKEHVPFINSDEPIGKIKKDCYCKEGDIVFADASEDLNDVGKSIEIVNLNDEKMVSGLHTLLARPKEAKLVIGFGGYLFKSNCIREQIKKEAQGAKVLGISAGRMSKIEVTFPQDKKEQQKIADCLSSLDDLIAAHTEKHQALQSYKKGLLQNLFPAEGKTVPALRFPEFGGSEQWELRELSEFIRERSQTPNRKVPLFSLTIEQGVTPKTKRYERSFLVKNKDDAYKVVLKNDFAYNPMNLRFGAIAKYAGDEDVALSKYYNIFYCDNSVDPAFCEYYFRSYNLIRLYDNIATGSLIEKRRVHFSEFLKLEIPFPPHEEQQKIAEHLSSADDLITAQAQKIEELKSHKKGLMQQLFPAVNEVVA